MHTTTAQTHILLSKKGMQELVSSIDALETDRLNAVQDIRDLDISLVHDERLGRIEKLAALDSIEHQLEQRKSTLQQARLLPSRRARARVAIGSVVDLIDQQGRMIRYTIVSSFEANPSDGRISADSPLGQSLIGKAAHETVEWSTSLRAQRLQLVRIS